jgi:hypothetical protein
LRLEVIPTSALNAAIRKGLRATWDNLLPILVLQGAMAATVAAYFVWPAGSEALSRFAAWQHSGGFLAAAAATALAGGAMSEVSLVYLRDKGRWTPGHLGNLGFKLVMFFISGGIVFEFYQWQAVWFGTGLAWSVVVPKVLVDQFLYTVLWSTPYQTLMTRWQALNYSGRRLWNELNADFIAQRMLPVLVTNWMLWIPCVTFIYSMPLNIQMPLAIFATAIWAILLATVSKQERGTRDITAPVLPEIMTAIPE